MRPTPSGSLLLLLVVSWLPSNVSAQSSTLNMSRDLISNGIVTSNMQPNSSTLDACPLFEAAATYAAKNGITRLIADPGTYYFLSERNTSTHALIRL